MYNNNVQNIFVQTVALVYKNFPVRTVRIKYHMYDKMIYRI